MSQPVIFGAGIGDGRYEMGWFNGCSFCGYDGIGQWNTGTTPGCRRGAAGGGRFIEEAWSAGGPYVGGNTYQFRECQPIVYSRSGSADTKFLCNQGSVIENYGPEFSFLDPCRNN